MHCHLAFNLSPFLNLQAMSLQEKNSNGIRQQCHLQLQSKSSRKTKLKQLFEINQQPSPSCLSSWQIFVASHNPYRETITGTNCLKIHEER